MIASFINDNHETRDQFLREFAYALRMAVHETTWKTPAERRRDVNIKVNDWVLEETHLISSKTKKVVAKFKPKFEGPYRVLSVETNNVVIWMAGRRTTLNIDRVRIYHRRKNDEGVIEVERSVSSTSDYQSSSFEENRPSLDQSQGFRSSESSERRGDIKGKRERGWWTPSPEENCLGDQSRTTGIDTPDSSPNNRADNSQSRIKGKDDPVITFPDRINTPDSSPNNRVDNSQSRIKGKDDPIITFPDRINTPDSSPNNRVDNSQSRIKGKDDPVITFPDRINTPDSSPNNRIDNSQSRIKGKTIQSFPSQTESTLQTAVQTTGSTTARVESKGRTIQSSSSQTESTLQTAVQTTRSPTAVAESEEWRIQSSPSQT
ncbi:uncharacterized protein TNCV_1783381 [Trichonephila clavipes]|nr:uncharacterized protein TNCV_1783381 [Trichonephila clavipes]